MSELVTQFGIGLESLGQYYKLQRTAYRRRVGRYVVYVFWSFKQKMWMNSTKTCQNTPFLYIRCEHNYCFLLQKANWKKHAAT